MSIASSIAGGGGSSGGGGGSGDVTGPASSTDNTIARFDGTGGKTIQGSSVVVTDEGALLGFITSAVALDDNYLLLATDSGRSFNIRLAGGPATITLPAAPAQGFFFEVFVANTDEVTVQFVGSQVAYLGASPTSAAGTLKSSTKGSKVRVCQEAPNLFSAVAVGTWTAA